VKNTPRLFLYTRRNAGSILVIVIWVMVFFSILCVGLYGIITTQIRLTKRIEDSIISEYLAKAAAAYAVEELFAKDKTDYDTLYELRVIREKELGYGKFNYTVTDEESKINVNMASVELLEALPGINTQLATVITETGVRPFHAKEELKLVEGVTDEIFEQCKNFITIYSDNKVNINTASLQTLAALGLDEQTASAIVDFRKGPDFEEATEDDEFFESTGEIIEKLRAFRGLSDVQAEDILGLISQGVFIVNSKNFTLDIETKVLNKTSMRYSVVIGEDGIKQWQEW